MRLTAKLGPPSTLVAVFPTVQAAGDAVLGMVGIRQVGILELMDNTTIRAVEGMTRMGLDTESGAIVLAQSDGPDGDGAFERRATLCEAARATYVAFTADPNEGESLLAARRLALPALERLGDTLLDDVCLPLPELPHLIERVEEIASANALTIGTFGHAGDGNLHPTIVFNARDAESTERAQRAFDEILTVALGLGGTITGEHGVGDLKAPYLQRMVGRTELDLMRRIKHAFDPDGILNPGKWL